MDEGMGMGEGMGMAGTEYSCGVEEHRPDSISC